MALVDLSRAFDSVCHDVLLSKLQYYGIRGKELQFFKSYLVGRFQLVHLGTEASSFREVLAGVPQGSVLGPLLFTIFINDLPSSMPCKTLLYADDTSFLHSGNDFQQTESFIQAMIDYGKMWFDSNFLTVNDAKTERICFSLRNMMSQDVSGIKYDHVKLLGITLDVKLTWVQHANSVISKLARVCFLLRRLKKCVSINMVTTAYHSFFHTHLLYGNLLWGNSSGAKQVFVWQKKALRIMFDIPIRVSCKPYFIENKIMTLCCIFIFQNIIFVKENVNKFFTRDTVHSYYTRGSTDLNAPAVRLSKFVKSHKYLQIKFYNKIPENFRGLDIKAFKRRLSRWLMSKAFYSIEEFFICNDFACF
jgi:hypothetical protein